MKHVLIYPRGTTDACTCAATYLAQAGYSLTDHPCPEVTHLLLDVPSFSSDGQLRGGGSIQRELEMLPDRISIIGGKLDHPTLSGYTVFDLLKEPTYLANNAAITAECALRIAGSLLCTTLPDTPTLVIGWGRIGKMLTKLLSAMGCPITVAARNPNDRAITAAMGWRTVEILRIPEILPRIRLIFNTVPAPILNAEILDGFRKCLKIDLASSPGLQGYDVVYARGLPGQYAPESSGKRIAQSVIQHLKEESL